MKSSRHGDLNAKRPRSSSITPLTTAPAERLPREKERRKKNANLDNKTAFPEAYFKGDRQRPLSRKNCDTAGILRLSLSRENNCVRSLFPYFRHFSAGVRRGVDEVRSKYDRFFVATLLSVFARDDALVSRKMQTTSTRYAAESSLFLSCASLQEETTDE